MIFPKNFQNSQAVAEHYNDLDIFYREFWGEHVHHGFWKDGKETVEEAVHALIELVANHARLQSGMEVCDIGCGYGATARMLSQKWQAQVTAITLSKNQHSYARTLPLKGNDPKYLLGDWLENQLPSESMDAVVSIESSEHMVDKEIFFRQAYRVLRPQGKMVICAWLAKEKPNAFEIQHLLEPICREGCLPSMGSANEYIDFFQSSGFQNVKFQDISSQVSKTWTYVGIRVLKALVTNANFRDFVLKSPSKNRVFFKTIFRLRAAYFTGSMRYGIFSAEKPQ